MHMKLPNFRLYDTQATTSMLVAIFCSLCLVMMTVVIFKGINTENWVIPYNPEAGMGQYRPSLVLLFTAVSILGGGVAAFMGFRSLGQQRNSKQGRSMVGLLLGVVVIPLSIVLYATWKELSEPIIRSTGAA